MNNHWEMVSRRNNLWLVFKRFGQFWLVFQCKSKQYLSICQSMKIYDTGWGSLLPGIHLNLLISCHQETGTAWACLIWEFTVVDICERITACIYSTDQVVGCWEKNFLPQVGMNSLHHWWWSQEWVKQSLPRQMSVAALQYLAPSEIAG